MATNRTMYLYHVSPIVNWFPIGVHGVTPEFSTSFKPAVFLVSAERIEWAIEHVAKRFNLERSQLMIVSVRVRRSKLTPVRFRTAKRGLWRHNGRINPDRIERIDPVSDEYNGCRLPVECFDWSECE
jgi:hypothetical protein